MVHLHNGVLCSDKKDDIMNFAGKWMELDAIMLSEVTQSQKNKGKWSPSFVHARTKFVVERQTKQS